MDDPSKQSNGPPPSGEIFSEGSHSAYEEAMAAPSEEVAGPSSVPFEDSANPPVPDAFSVPPAYIEDPRRKFLFLALFVIIIVVVGVVALRFLGSRSTTPTGSNGQKTEKITLTYWGLWEEESIMSPLIEKFEKENNQIEVNYVRQDPVQYRERVQAAIDRGEGPDIFRFHNTWLPMLVKQLAPLPKDVISDEEYGKTFYPVVLQDLKGGDNFYGIPLEIDGLLLFYNEDILNGANVTVPLTWIDIQNSVSRLTVKEGNLIATSAIALGTAENIEHFSDILGLMMLQNGTKLYESLFSCSDAAETDCAVQTLKFYRMFAAPPSNTWDNSLENSIVAFAGGKTAMIIAPSWQALTINSINPDLNFKTAKVPQLPCDRDPCPEINWASYWVEGVSVKSKKQDTSWQFLKFLLQPENMQKLYEGQSKVRKLFGEPYSRVDLGKNLSDNPYLSPLISEAPTMKSFYLSSRTFDGETGINTSLIDYLKDAVNGLSEQGVSEESVIKTAESGFGEVFKRFNLSYGQKQDNQGQTGENQSGSLQVQ